MIRVGRVQLGERRHPLFSELREVPAAHRRDEAAGGNRLRARSDDRLHVRDRRRGFEARVVAGPQAEQDDVVVVVDEAGHDRPALEIDRPRAWAERAAALAHRREHAALNRYFGRGRVLRVHRLELAVDEAEVARAVAARGRGLRGGGSGRERDEQQRECFHV